jgi:hypothetical protein
LKGTILGILFDHPPELSKPGMGGVGWHSALIADGGCEASSTVGSFLQLAIVKRAERAEVP